MQGNIRRMLVSACFMEGSALDAGPQALGSALDAGRVDAGARALDAGPH